MQSDLIYDVGLFDGTDTAYYLARGFKVVAIDANPIMAENAKRKFSKEIQAGRLTVLNLGISKEPGEATFYVSDVPAWSSFDRAIAGRRGTPHKGMPIPTVPFSKLLEEHGHPHYVKIDIEGHDKMCVDDLNSKPLPKFISVETECTGDTTAISDEEATATLQSLRDVGYSKFKLVNQNTQYSVRSNPISAFVMHLVNSAAYGKLSELGVSAVAKRFTDASRASRMGADLSTDSSGLWGDDLPGGWMTFEKARSLYLKTREAYFKTTHDGFWYDWHAAT